MTRNELIKLLEDSGFKYITDWDDFSSWNFIYQDGSSITVDLHKEPLLKQNNHAVKYIAFINLHDSNDKPKAEKTFNSNDTWDDIAEFINE